jgi:hypothetical protein
VVAADKLGTALGCRDGFAACHRARERTWSSTKATSTGTTPPRLTAVTTVSGTTGRVIGFVSG